MRKFAYIPLLIFLVVLTYSSTAGVSYVDSLKVALKSLDNRSKEKYETLIKLAKAYSDTNYSVSLEYWQEAFQTAQKIGDRGLIADVYHQIGYTYMNQGEYKTSLENLENAAAIYRDLDSLKSYAGILNDIGLIYRNWGKYDKALEYYLKALDISKTINYHEGVGMTSNSIGQIYYYREDYSNAINFFKEYYNASKQLGNARAVAGASNNIASSYLELGKNDEALEYFLKSLKIYDSLGISIGVAIIQDNIGSLYYKQKLYDNALLYHLNALEIFESLQSPARICYTKKNIGEVLLAQGKIDRAIEMFDSSIKIAKEIGLKDVERDSYKFLSECYNSKQNYKKAYDFLLNHMVIKDSILNSESIQKLEELRAQYENEKKEQELQAISSKLKTQRTFVYVSAAFIALLISIIALFYLENKKKKRAISRLESLKNYIFQNFTQNICNLDIIKTDKSLVEPFNNSWDLFDLGVEIGNKLSFYHFKIGSYTICYYISHPQNMPCCDIINFNIYIKISKFIKDNGEVNEKLTEEIHQYLKAETLLKFFNENDLILYPFVLKGKKILSLCPKNMALRQFGSFIYYDNSQWMNIRESDIVYIFGSARDIKVNNELRKIVKSIDLLEFDEQREMTINLLKTENLIEDVFISAFKV
ncbi:tetratricopeptide repeat protein [Tenuifilum thalassicum]|uniref:Tetratricopeptide repeat protein n=1 Tax=Tenuifilum thalassicum TaxID=2590900 RepID=A0A7D3XM86_9BACT|nr:tetratricopeptide repeat protein [Tenuifilum thalassicum]QKG81010.1 tetratricopeptide repeat protein [Tenuifilum thalassicum]